MTPRQRTQALTDLLNGPLPDAIEAGPFVIVEKPNPREYDLWAKAHPKSKSPEPIASHTSKGWAFWCKRCKEKHLVAWDHPICKEVIALLTDTRVEYSLFCVSGEVQILYPGQPCPKGAVVTRLFPPR